MFAGESRVHMRVSQVSFENSICINFANPNWQINKLQRIHHLYLNFWIFYVRRKFLKNRGRVSRFQRVSKGICSKVAWFKCGRGVAVVSDSHRPPSILLRSLFPLRLYLHYNFPRNLRSLWHTFIVFLDLTLNEITNSLFSSNRRGPRTHQVKLDPEFRMS